MNNLDIIEEQLKADKPKKGFVRTAMAGINALKGTVEFAAAVTALVQFVQTIL